MQLLLPLLLSLAGLVGALCEDGCQLPWRNDVCDGAIVYAAEELIGFSGEKSRLRIVSDVNGQPAPGDFDKDAIDGAQTADADRVAARWSRMRAVDGASTTHTKVRKGQWVTASSSSGLAYFEVRCSHFDSKIDTARTLAERLQMFSKPTPSAARNAGVIFYTLCSSDDYAKTYCDPLRRSFEHEYRLGQGLKVKTEEQEFHNYHLVMVTDSELLVERYRNDTETRSRKVEHQNAEDLRSGTTSMTTSTTSPNGNVHFLPWQKVCSAASAEKALKQLGGNCENQSNAMYSRLLSFLEVLEHFSNHVPQGAGDIKIVEDFHIVVLDSDALFVSPILNIGGSWGGSSSSPEDVESPHAAWDFGWVVYEVARAAPYEDEWFEQPAYCNHRGNVNVLKNANAAATHEERLRLILIRLEQMERFRFAEREMLKSKGTSKGEGGGGEGGESKSPMFVEDEKQKMYRRLAEEAITGRPAAEEVEDVAPRIESEDCFLRPNAGLFVMKNGQKQREYLRVMGELSGFFLHADSGLALEDVDHPQTSSSSSLEKEPDYPELRQFFPELFQVTENFDDHSGRVIRQYGFAKRLRTLFRGPDQIAIAYMLFRSRLAYQNGNLNLLLEVFPEDEEGEGDDGAQMKSSWQEMAEEFAMNPEFSVPFGALQGRLSLTRDKFPQVRDLMPGAQILKAWDHDHQDGSDQAALRAKQVRQSGGPVVRDPRFQLRHKILPMGRWFLSESQRWTDNEEGDLPFAFHFKGRAYWNVVLNDLRLRPCLKWRELTEFEKYNNPEHFNATVLDLICGMWSEDIENPISGATRKIDWLKDALALWGKYSFSPLEWGKALAAQIKKEEQMREGA